MFYKPNNELIYQENDLQFAQKEVHINVCRSERTLKFYIFKQYMCNYEFVLNQSSFQSTPVFKDTPASSPFTLGRCSTHPSQLWLLCWGSGWPGGCPGWTEPRRPRAPTRAPAQVFGGISPRRCRDPGWSSRRAAGQGSAPRWGSAVHPSAGLNRSSICGSLLCLRDQEDKHTPFYKSITHNPTMFINITKPISGYRETFRVSVT